MRIIKPTLSGSTHHNYKGFFSLVLMAAVDADYRFIYVDVGMPGRISDGGVFNRCKLCRHLEDANNPLQIPAAERIDGIEIPIPYMLVGDDAFPLKDYLMKPYGRHDLTPLEENFNYRLSRARRIVENAFAHLSNRFRLFHARIETSVSTARKAVLAAVILHNVIKMREESSAGEQQADKDPASRLLPLPPLRGGGRHIQTAKTVRDSLATYFAGPGSVPWRIM